VIKGELVNIRAADRHDAADLYRWFNNPDVMRYWGKPSSTPSLTEVQRQIEAWLDLEGRLGRPVSLIVETLEGKAVGLIQLNEYKPESRSAELSFFIGEPNLWGRGIGTDMLETVIETCFDEWNLRRIWARSEAFNERAHRLFKRCGFSHEATLRDASFFEGAFHDVLMFGLLASDRSQNDPLPPTAAAGTN
jgi:RimJ/RimL family protein N-acetyltransferase